MGTRCAWATSVRFTLVSPHLVLLPRRNSRPKICVASVCASCPQASSALNFRLIIRMCAWHAMWTRSCNARGYCASNVFLSLEYVFKSHEWHEFTRMPCGMFMRPECVFSGPRMTRMNTNALRGNSSPNGFVQIVSLVVKKRKTFSG